MQLAQPRPTPAASRLMVLWVAALLLAMPALSLGSSARAQPDESSARTPSPLPISIDVNTASAAELERVKGVGPRIAARIVQARERGGRFRDAEDLQQRVQGIGPAKLKTMRAAGLEVPQVRPGTPAALKSDRVELISGRPARKAESAQGGAIVLPGEPLRR